MVDSRSDGHVPFSICVNAAIGVTLVAKKNIRGTPRFVALFRKVNSTVHTNARGLNCGYIGNTIVLFVLGTAVGVTMGDEFMI